MQALIVGGDRVGPIVKALSGHGVGRIRHWSGRKGGDLKRVFPEGTGLVVVLCDSVNHRLAEKVRRAADSRSIPIVFCPRSPGRICARIDALLAGLSCGGCQVGIREHGGEQPPRH